MRSEKFNSEGYYDPTPYEALSNIFGEQRFAFRPIVYICSPYAGDVEGNVAAVPLLNKIILSAIFYFLLFYNSRTPGLRILDLDFRILYIFTPK